jgi:hypothetical protein
LRIPRATIACTFHSDAAFAKRGKDATVYLIPDAGAVVPVLTPGSM